MTKTLLTTAVAGAATCFWWLQPGADEPARPEPVANPAQVVPSATSTEVRAPAAVVWQAPSDRTLTPRDDFERARQLAIHELSRIPEPPTR